MNPTFKQLNFDWNAEPNAPDPQVEWQGSSLRLRFLLNAFQFPTLDVDDSGEIVFEDCSRFRLGNLNDEGWHRDQGRFDRNGHQWGEFYEVIEGLGSGTSPDDWIVRCPDSPASHHFLFYFRDNDFECVARQWTLSLTTAQQENHLSSVHDFGT